MSAVGEAAAKCRSEPAGVKTPEKDADLDVAHNVTTHKT
jgi:hypothetical protein